MKTYIVLLCLTIAYTTSSLASESRQQMNKTFQCPAYPTEEKSLSGFTTHLKRQHITGISKLTSTFLCSLCVAQKMHEEEVTNISFEEIAEKFDTPNELQIHRIAYHPESTIKHNKKRTIATAPNKGLSTKQFKTQKIHEQDSAFHPQPELDSTISAVRPDVCTMNLNAYATAMTLKEFDSYFE
ncbi:MAG: hypothetical protein WCE21_02060 [Candidatus Babeliales bacterium]